MKIVFFIDIILRGGAGKFLVDMFTKMNRLGIDTYLILVEDRIRIKIPEEYSDKVLFLCEKENAIKPRFLKYHILSKKLNKVLENDIGSYDMIISNLQYADKVLSLAKVPKSYYCIHSNMSIDFFKFKKTSISKKIKTFRLRKFYSNKNIITVSRGIKKDILENIKIKPNFIKTIYNPFEFDIIKEKSFEKDLLLPKEEFILHIGRFHIHQKRQDILLKAFKKVDTKLKLVLLGNGDEEEEVLSLIKKNNLEDRVIVPGFRENPFVWIKKARMLVLSSDYEGFGRVLVEALSLNTPIVSVDCPNGPNEILVDNLEKYLAKKGDIQDLVNKISLALKEYPIIKKEYYEKFDIKYIIEQYLEIAKMEK